MCACVCVCVRVSECVRVCVRVRVRVSLHLEVVTEACSLQGQEPGAFPVRAGVSRRGRRGNERRKRRISRSRCTSGLHQRRLRRELTDQTFSDLFLLMTLLRFSRAPEHQPPLRLSCSLMRVCTHALTHTRTCTRMHAHIYTHMYACTHTHVRTHTNTHTHTHTHTHTDTHFTDWDLSQSHASIQLLL